MPLISHNDTEASGQIRAYSDSFFGLCQEKMKYGLNVKTVSNNLGHATTAFTMDKYGHVTETMMRDSADKMQRFIESL